MRIVGLACALVVGTMGTAAADDTLYERLWPKAPVRGGLSLSQQITDSLTELGNTVGTHVSVLSGGEIEMRFDGRRRRAQVRLGLVDDERYLVFTLAGDVHFENGVARCQATLRLGIAGHLIALELPGFEMAPASVNGERGVEIRLPFYKRSF